MPNLRATAAVALAAMSFTTPRTDPRVELLWTARLETDADVTILATDAAVIVRTDRDFTAYDPAAGRALWSRPLDRTAAFDARGSHVAVADGASIEVLAAADGTRVWRAATAEPPARLLIVPGGVVGVTGRRVQFVRGTADAGWTVVLDADPAPAWAVQDNLLLISATPSAIVAIDRTRGAVTWSLPMPAAVRDFTATASGLFVCLDNGQFARYHLRPGGAAWTQNLIPATGTPAADDRSVFAAFLDNSVRLFNQSNGHWRWSTVVPFRPAGGPAIVGAVVAVALENGQVAEVKIDSGQLLPAQNPANLPPVVRITDSAAVAGGLYTAGIAPDQSRTLFAWGRKPPAVTPAGERR